jgi:hypothetical protein
MNIKTTLEIKGAKLKLKMQSNVPAAAAHIVNKWGAETVLRLKQAATGRIVGKGERKTGQLGRNVGMKTRRRDQDAEMLLGTGVAPGSKTVRYANVLDLGTKRALGGPIRPKRAKMLTIPLPGIKGMAKEYPDAFIIKSKKGNVLLVEPDDNEYGFRPLFVLKQEITIDPFYWFSGTIKERRPFLDRNLNPVNLLNLAKRMSQ